MRRWGVLLGLLWLQSCLVRGIKVDQMPSSLSPQEGTSSTLRCNFSFSATSVQWFRQNTGGSLINLFYISSGTKESGRLSVTVNSKERFSTLNITSFQLQDSATYFCAAGYGGAGNRLNFGTGTLLSVKPNIRDPKPTVYQLTKSRSSNMTVCLYTDYQSGEDISKVTEDAVFSTNTTVLQMKSTGSKSNAILVWDHRVDFTCRSVFKDNILVDTSEVPCDATLVEKNFRTDWNLNFQNLLVIVFRILFLKLSGFNLLMTLRLWSC